MRTQKNVHTKEWAGVFKLLTGSVYVGGDKEGNKADKGFQVSRWT